MDIHRLINERNVVGAHALPPKKRRDVIPQNNAAMIDKPHPSIWKFVNALKREAAQNKLVLAQMVAGASPPTPKKVYREVSSIFGSNFFGQVLSFYSF